MLNGDDTSQDNMLNSDLDNKPVVNAVDSLDPYLIAA